MADEKLNLKPALVAAVVARGRTIMVPHPTKRTLAYNHPETGAAVMRPEMVAFGEGSTVELTKEEITNLRERGFLTDPSKIVQPVAEGSHVSEIGNQTTVKAA